MTELLHMKDSYLKEFEAKVVNVTDRGIVLDRTAFYPRKGGVDCDTGVLIAGGREIKIKEVLWDGEVLHIPEKPEPISAGTPVKGRIDWERRYHLMKLHTAAHLLEAVIFKRTGALIGSGRVEIGGSYLGFTLENMDRELISEAVNEANSLIQRGAPVRIYFLPREEALKDPEMVKLASRLPPAVRELRIVEIEGIDRQACGGPHVANIKEIGNIEIIRIKNKGKGNRRLYYEIQ